MLRGVSWQKLFYYSEAVGVLIAWGVGLLVALDRTAEQEEPRPVDRIAVVSTASP